MIILRTLACQQFCQFNVPVKHEEIVKALYIPKRLFTRILRKTHVPVSDTRTPRILPDTYPVNIGNLCDFQIIKMNRILLRSLTDTCGIPWNWYSYATYKSNLCSCTTTLYKQVGSSCYVMCLLNLSLNDGFMAWTLCLEPLNVIAWIMLFFWMKNCGGNPRLNNVIVM